MVFDPSDPMINVITSPCNCANTESGINMKEQITDNTTESRGQGFLIRAFIDANHAGNSITRRSRIGFIIDLNCVLMNLMSIKHGSVETSSFGPEFMAIDQYCEYP